MDPSTPMDTSGESQRQKPLSEANQRPNPNIKRKVFPGWERDNTGPPKKLKQTPLTKAEKEANKSERQRNEEQAARNMLQSYLSKIRGSDTPMGPAIARWGKARHVKLLVRPEGSTAYGLMDVSFKYDREYHRPGLIFRKAGYELRIRSNNFLSHSTQGPFVQVGYKAKTDVGTFSKMMLAEHGIHNLQETEARENLKFGDGGKDVVGIDILSFKAHNNDETFFDEKSENVCLEMEAFLQMLNKSSCKVSIVRKSLQANAILDGYMKSVIEKAVNQGVFHNLNECLSGQGNGAHFQAWQDQPNKLIPRPYHMRTKGSDEDRESTAVKYAALEARKCVRSMRELEIQQSMALVYGDMNENDQIRAYFSHGKLHDAKVLSNKAGYIEVGVQVKNICGFAMPAVGYGTKLQVQYVGYDTPKEDEAVEPAAADSGPPQDDLILPDVEPKPEKAPAVPKFIGPKWQGRAVENDNEKDYKFVLGFFVKDFNARQQWRKDEQIKVSLHMSRNPIPSKRMLKSIGKICKKLGNKDAVKKRYLQRFLIGAGNPDYEKEADGSPKPGVKEDYFKKLLTPKQQARWLDFVSKLGLNKRQQKLFDHIFNTREFVTQLQGPPGTGKTKTISAICMGFVLLQCRTVCCAPSNTAVDGIMNNLLDVLATLDKVDPQAKEEFHVILVRPSALFKADLEDMCLPSVDKAAEKAQYDADKKIFGKPKADTLQRERAKKRKDAAAEEGEVSMAHEMASSLASSKQDKYHEFNLSTHVLRSFKEKSEKPGNDQGVKDARDWVKWYDALTTGAPITAKEKRKFLEWAMVERQKVVSDPKVKLAVCTNNTADQLSEWGFQPMACIVDEAAFATEQDSCVPLSLGARFHVIAGDHEQLRPIVRSRGNNICENQLRLSLYERFYGHHSVPLFRLKVNYRMHPDIADLPGMLTYEWLECAANTRVDSEEFKYWQDFWSSDTPAAKRYRLGNRPPRYGNVASQSIRRMMFVPEDGRSAAKEGETSIRNNANINCVTDLVEAILMHIPSLGIEDLAGSKITVLTPYKESKAELEKQIRWALLARDPNFQCFPVVSTVDSLQGGENEIIILELTPANEFNGSLLGFLREWNRINVAITRAKSVLLIVGNMDAWMKQLKIIVEGLKCKKFALMLIDLLDKGDVIDVEGIQELPATFEERRDGSPETWSQKMNHADQRDSALMTEKLEILRDAYVTPEVKQQFELKLLNELAQLRLNAQGLKNLADEGIDMDLSMQVRLEGEAHEEDVDREHQNEPESDDDATRQQVEQAITDSLPRLEKATAGNKGKGKAVDAAVEDVTDEEEIDEQPVVSGIDAMTEDEQIEEAARRSKETATREQQARVEEVLFDSMQATGESSKSGDVDTAGESSNIPPPPPVIGLPVARSAQTPSTVLAELAAQLPQPGTSFPAPSETSDTIAGPSAPTNSDSTIGKSNFLSKNQKKKQSRKKKKKAEGQAAVQSQGANEGVFGNLAQVLDEVYREEKPAEDPVEKQLGPAPQEDGGEPDDLAAKRQAVLVEQAKKDAEKAAELAEQAKKDAEEAAELAEQEKKNAMDVVDVVEEEQL